MHIVGMTGGRETYQTFNLIFQKNFSLYFFKFYFKKELKFFT
jgi:hypothetical protein